MGLFEHFPYTNYHDLNLDKILERTKEAEEAVAASEAAVLAAAADMAAASAAATNAVNTANAASAAASNAVNTANAANTAAGNAQTAAGNAANSALAAQNSANAAAASVEYLAENLQIGYKTLFDNEGYFTHNTAAISAGNGKSGLVIVGASLVFWIGGLEANASQTYTYTYTKLMDFDASINDFVPDKFFSKGLGWLNNNLIEIVISKGQPSAYFQDGIWFRPAGGSSITSGANSVGRTFLADPIVIARLEDIFS